MSSSCFLKIKQNLRLRLHRLRNLSTDHQPCTKPHVKTFAKSPGPQFAMSDVTDEPDAKAENEDRSRAVDKGRLCPKRSRG
jgi:hypothetical protein